MKILGISAYYHDSAAALLVDGVPVAAVQESALSMTLANGSRVVSLPGKDEGSIRGFSAVTTLVIDEAARVPDEVFSGASPTMAVSRGRFVALSTAFAKSGFFYREWTSGGPDYLRRSVTARDCPRIPPEFLASERRKLGPRLFEMEYMNIFGDDVAAVFSAEDIRAAMSDDVLPLFTPRAVPPDEDGPAPLFGARP